MTQDAGALLPCPFCGGRAAAGRTYNFETTLFKVQCMSCPAAMKGYDQSEADAIDAWNTRQAAAQGNAGGERSAVQSGDLDERCAKALAMCDHNPWSTVKALLHANDMLDAEVKSVAQAAGDSGVDANGNPLPGFQWGADQLREAD